jgi:hypothetical protein
MPDKEQSPSVTELDVGIDRILFLRRRSAQGRWLRRDEQQYLRRHSVFAALAIDGYAIRPPATHQADGSFAEPLGLRE